MEQTKRIEGLQGCRGAGKGGRIEKGKRQQERAATPPDTQERRHEAGSAQPVPAGQEQSSGGQHPEPGRPAPLPAGAAPAPPPRPGLRERARAHSRGRTATDTGAYSEIRPSLGGRRFAPRGFSSITAHGGGRLRAPTRYGGAAPPAAGRILKEPAFPSRPVPLPARRSRSFPPGARLSRQPRRSNLLCGRRSVRLHRHRSAEPGEAELRTPEAARRGPLPPPPPFPGLRGAARTGAPRSGQDGGPTGLLPTRALLQHRLASPRPAAARLLPPFLPPSPPSPRSRRLRSRRRRGLQRRPPPGGQEARHHSGTAPTPSARLSARAARAALPLAPAERGRSLRRARGAQPVPGRETAG